MKIQNYSVILVLLFSVLVTGQLSEIKEQTLRYGDYVQQLAVIHILNGSIDYFILCEDCTATISVKRIDDNSPIITNKNMTLLDVGLFGYLANPMDFISGVQYRAFINTTSLNYGSGIAMSTFTISKNQNITPVISSGEGGYLSGMLDGLTDILNIVWDNTFGVIIGNFSTAFNSNFLGVKDFISTITGYVSDILNLFKPLFNGFKWLVNWFIERIMIFVNNPIGTALEGTISYFLVIAAGIILPILVPIVFIEMGVFFYVLIKNENIELNLFNFLGGIFKANFDILKFIAGLFSGIITVIRNIKTATIGDAV